MTKKTHERTRRIQFSCTLDEYRLIEEGALIDRRPVNNFIISSATKRAKKLKLKLKEEAQ